MPEYRIVADLPDWQWALAAALLTAALVLGGWWQRQREPEAEPELQHHSDLQDREAIAELQEQLNQREAELQEAREEAELILLQLHQVQEELEHYFLESRDLQQKLDERSSEPAPGISAQHLAQVQRIKSRLVSLFAALPAEAVSAAAPDPRLLTLLQRQQSALRRFQRLQLAQR